VAFKGHFEANIAKIAGLGYDGVELAIRDQARRRRLENYSLNVNDFLVSQVWGFNVLQPPPALHFCATMPPNRGARHR
jgi:hypothetical protein